jgi:putative sigma-54 modulation protein
MQVSVTFRHMDATEALREYAEEKIDKALRKFLKTTYEAHVVLSTERYQHLCDVTVLVSGHTIKGSEKSGDMYTSIDKVGDKIERQVARYKDKLRSHKPSSLDAAFKVPEVLVSLLDQQEAPSEGGAPEKAPEPKVLKSETVVARPMSIDDAVMAMDLSQAPFQVFTNSQTGGVAVIYRMPDGKYGLVDTKPGK